MEDSPSIAILEWGTGGSLGGGALPRPPADHGSLYCGRDAHLGSAVCAVGEGSRGQQRGQPLLLEVQMKKWHQTIRPTQGEDGQVQQQLCPAKEESAIPPRGGSLMSSGGQKVT